MKVHFCAAALLLLIISVVAPQAAEISAVPPPDPVDKPVGGYDFGQLTHITTKPMAVWVRVDGRIEKGDARKLQRIVDRARRADKTIFTRLILNSRGGDYDEALAMAERYNQTTIVENNGVCHAACAMLFISGRTVSGDGYFPPSRYAHRSADINFFAPKFDFPDNASSRELKAAYEQATRLSRTLLTKRGTWHVPNEFFLALVEPKHEWRTFAKKANITVFGGE